MPDGPSEHRHDLSTSWPSHDRETRPWQQTLRGGTREDRMLSQIEAALPPYIADTALLIDAALAAEMESALREIGVRIARAAR